jgi:hypothetical protein
MKKLVEWKISMSDSKIEDKKRHRPCFKAEETMAGKLKGTAPAII